MGEQYLLKRKACLLNIPTMSPLTQVIFFFLTRNSPTWTAFFPQIMAICLVRCKSMLLYLKTSLLDNSGPVRQQILCIMYTIFSKKSHEKLSVLILCNSYFDTITNSLNPQHSIHFLAVYTPMTFLKSFRMQAGHTIQSHDTVTMPGE